MKVYRFNEDSQIWERRGNEIIGGAKDDASGFSVAINDGGNRIAAGAIYTVMTEIMVTILILDMSGFMILVIMIVYGNRLDQTSMVSMEQLWMDIILM